MCMHTHNSDWESLSILFPTFYIHTPVTYSLHVTTIHIRRNTYVYCHLCKIIQSVSCFATQCFPVVNCYKKTVVTRLAALNFLFLHNVMNNICIYMYICMYMYMPYILAIHSSRYTHVNNI